jgi:hypothetical protein
MSEKGNAYESHNDSPEGWRQIMDQFVAVARELCGSFVVNVQPLAGNKRDLISWLSDNRKRLCDIATWDKGHGAPQMADGVLSSRFEWLVVLADEGATRTIPFSSWQGDVQNVYEGPPQQSNEYADSHAATFPVHLPKWVMGTLCDIAETFYDPFAGTGTSIIAAEQEGRTCYAMEIDASYVAVCLQRAEDAGLDVNLISGPSTNA